MSLGQEPAPNRLSRLGPTITWPWPVPDMSAQRRIRAETSEAARNFKRLLDKQAGDIKRDCSAFAAVARASQRGKRARWSRLRLGAAAGVSPVSEPLCIAQELLPTS